MRARKRDAQRIETEGKVYGERSAVIAVGAVPVRSQRDGIIIDGARVSMVNHS